MTRFREPSTAVMIHPLNDIDPRGRLDGGVLVDASRNRYPIVAATRPRRDSLSLAAGTGVAVLLGMLTFWTMSGHRSPAPASTTLPTREFSLARPAPSTALAPAPPAGSFMLPHTQSWAQIQTRPGARTDPARDPMIVFDASGSPAVETASASTPPPSAAATPVGLAAAAEASTAGNGANARNEDDGFFSRIEGRNAQVATARQLSSPASTVTQGTLIAAVLETSINTDLPGYVRALVSRDVRSFDGSQILIPRSSRLIGQYKSGLAAGQTRAYVIWTRLIRPDGVSVMLDSPGVDFSGESGFAGKVNSHFMKRFGSALLLSVVGGLSAAGSGGATLIAGGGGQSAASVAAGHDGAISPTIRVSQGEPIRIFTARDLDFSTVPRLEASR
ncbi:MAG: TrbI/VirB10 family protein [Sphingomicrobium sp.]